MADISLDGLDAERINLSLENAEAQTVWWALDAYKTDLERRVGVQLQRNDTTSPTYYEELMWLYTCLQKVTTLMFDMRDDHASHIVPKIDMELAATGTDGTVTNLDPNAKGGNRFTNVVRKWLGVG
jgi:hypothetical protein